MIIFYKKDTGEIVGTIDGRVHGDGHMDMWIGDKNETGRLVCNWVKVDEDKDSVTFEPEKQKKIFYKLDKNPKEIRNYKVENGKLINKDDRI